MKYPLLSIKDLRIHFPLPQGTLKAVDGVSLDVDKGQIMGLVGESGGGKSMVGLSVLRLIPEGGKIASGEILFDRKNLLALSDDEMRNIRGADISMILQDPLASLNPAIRIKSQIVDVLKLHKGYGKKEAEIIATELLHNVGLPDLWQTFSIPTEQSIPALLPLLRGTLHNIETIGIPNCLTGPIARGDSGTIEKHIMALREKAPELLFAYKELGLQTVPIALAKGKIDRRQADGLETDLKSS